MRNKIAFIVAVCVFLTGCQITENIYLQEDGSGKITYDIDASELMALAGDKLRETGKDNIDSTMTFKQLFDEKKVSIAKMTAEDQQKLKKFEDVTMRMKMSAEQQAFNISLLKDFKNVFELQDMTEAMKAMQSLDKKNMVSDPSNPLAAMMGPGGNTELKYAYDGKVFRRTLRIIDPKIQAQAKDTTGMMRMMFAGSTYTIKYHFPKKVKSVSNPDALFSADRKTVTIPYPLAVYLEQPDKMSFEVVLDKK